MSALATGAGLAIGYVLKKLYDQAAETEANVRHLSNAYSGEGPLQAAKDLEAAVKISNDVSSALGLSADSLRDSLFAAKQMGLNNADSLKVMADAGKLSIGTTSSLDEASAALAGTTDFLSSAVKILGGNVDALTDKFAYLTSGGHGFKTIDDLHAALQPVLADIKTLGLNQNTVMAVSSVLVTSGGFYPGRAGMLQDKILHSMTAAKSPMRALAVVDAKGNLDEAATLQRTAGWIQNVHKVQAERYLKAAGYNEREIKGSRS